MKYIKKNKNCDLLIAEVLFNLQHRALRDGSVSRRYCQKPSNRRIKVLNNNCESVTPDQTEVRKRCFRTASKSEPETRLQDRELQLQFRVLKPKKGH